ncbi:MAG: flagellar biosynthetic protein FliO [Acidimicrobiia bacterium]
MGGDAFELIARLVPALIIVLGGPFAVRWLIRRGPGGSSNRMRVVERVSMGKAAQAVIVSVSDRRLLLGVTESQITLLSELEPESAADARVAFGSIERTPIETGTDAGSGQEAAIQPWDGFVERWRHLTTRRPSEELAHVYEH